jgi:mono/diheme cytochrome c family protein
MLRKLGWVLVGLAVVAVLAVAGLVVKAQGPLDAPYPEVLPDTSPEGLARGAVLFHGTCGQCHRGADGARASGAPLAELPAFLGTAHARNLTRHPTAGIGAMPDRALARLLRYGVTADGRAAFMPTYNLSDADLAAVMGFVRSDDPLFTPDATVSPPSRPSLLGRVLVTLGVPDPASRPVRGVTAPPKAATAAYGRYLAHDVFDCAGCHTPGYAPDKTQGEALLQGGAAFVGAAGEPIRSPNLTAHPTGLGDWTAAQLGRALREGVKPDGTAVRPPMPLFRGLEDVEVEALLAYLRSVPAREGEVPAARPRTAAAPREGAEAGEGARAPARPEVLFGELGCATCHAPGARFHAQLARARGKEAAQLARWILHPEAFQPGTPMPSYAGLLSEADALGLARWVKDAAP